MDYHRMEERVQILQGGMKKVQMHPITLDFSYPAAEAEFQRFTVSDEGLGCVQRRMLVLSVLWAFWAMLVGVLSHETAPIVFSAVTACFTFLFWLAGYLDWFKAHCQLVTTGGLFVYGSLFLISIHYWPYEFQALPGAYWAGFLLLFFPVLCQYLGLQFKFGLLLGSMYNIGFVFVHSLRIYHQLENQEEEEGGNAPAFGEIFFLQALMALLALILVLCHYRQGEVIDREQFLLKKELAAKTVRLEADANPFSVTSIAAHLSSPRYTPPAPGVVKMDDPSSEEEEKISDSDDPVAVKVERPSKRRIDDFVIPETEIVFKRKVASGSAGQVFVGSYAGHIVAVKELFSSLMGDGGLEELSQEAGALVRLRHPNVVVFYGVTFRNSRSLCLVTEFCPGHLCDAVLGTRAFPSTAGELVTCAREIASGMSFLHSRGVIHRDLKPANILLDAQNHVRICDFGLARVVSHTHSRVTTEGNVGTPAFLAPEMLTEGKSSCSTAVDVYSFGILLWMLVGLCPPYEGLKTLDIMRRVSSEQLRPPIPPRLTPARAALVGEVLAPLVQMMQACWQQDPRRRPTFAKIREDLSKME